MGTASHAPEQSSDGKGSVVTLALERVVSGLLVELFRLVRDVGPIALFGPILRCRILDADRNRVVSITKRLADGAGDFLRKRPLLGLRPAGIHLHNHMRHGIDPPLGLHHHLDRLAVVHGAVALGNALKIDRAVEDPTRLNAAFEDVWQQFLDIGAHRRGTAADDDVLVEKRLRGGDGFVMRDANAADRTARAGNTDGCVHSLVGTDAFQHGVNPRPPVRSRTRWMASSPRSLTMSVAPKARPSAM